MCGGAVISDEDPLFNLNRNRNRKPTANDLWSEFDTSDLFPWDFKPQTLPSKTTPISNKAEEAARAYDEAAKRIRGDKAKLNFHSPPAKKLCVQTPTESTQSTVHDAPSPPALLNYDQFQNQSYYSNAVVDDYEFKEEISKLETFLGLDHESTQFGGESSHVWMMDDFPVII